MAYYPEQGLLLSRIVLGAPTAPKCPLCKERSLARCLKYGSDMRTLIPSLPVELVCESCGFVVALCLSKKE